MKKTGIAVAVAILAATSGWQAQAETAPVEKQVERIVVRPGGEGGDGEIVVVSPRDLFPRSYLGVHITDLTPELRAHFNSGKHAGVMVSRIVEGSPAAAAGLEVGDIITSIEGEKISSSSDVRRAIRKQKEGDRLKIEFIRNGATQSAVATIAVREPKAFPEGPSIDPEVIERSREAARKLEAYFDSPEWKARIERMRDCGKLQERVEELEARLRELERQLQRK